MALSPAHRQHLHSELGSEEGVALAIRFGARSLTREEALRQGYRLRGPDGVMLSCSGLLLPFTPEWGQFRCDAEILNRKGSVCKYLNRAGWRQRIAVFGEGKPVGATEGWKDALRIHLETGLTVAALPGVTSWKLLPPSVRWIAYDADAAINHHVWGQLVKAGLERPELRLFFFPTIVAGPKGGACEFFNKGGTPEQFEQLVRAGMKARKLLETLPMGAGWNRGMEATLKVASLRAIVRLSLVAGLDGTTATQLATDTAFKLCVPKDAAKAMVTALAKEASTDDDLLRLGTAELQDFLLARHKMEFDTLRRTVVLDGVTLPPSDIRSMNQLLAMRYRLEVRRDVAEDTLRYLAACNPFNPIARYMEGLDKTEGLRLLSIEEIGKAFGFAPDDDLSHDLLAHHLVACLDRGLEPGCKCDQMVILRGGQGLCKSESLRALVPHQSGWHDEETVIEKFNDWPFLIRVGQTWLFTIDECDRMLRGKHSSEVKGMLTRRSDDYAEKNDRDKSMHPRPSVFWGTTNQSEILNDLTGVRRYWICDVVTAADPQWIAENRDSVWATVLSWKQCGAEGFLRPGDQVLAKAEERAWMATFDSPHATRLYGVLDTLAPDGTGIPQSELIRCALGVEVEQVTNRRELLDLMGDTARTVESTNFTTHDGTVRWEKRKCRFPGHRSPVVGFRPVLKNGPPAAAAVGFPPVPARTEGVPTHRNGVRPWRDRLLTSLFLCSDVKGKLLSEKSPAPHPSQEEGDTPFPIRVTSEKSGTSEHFPKIPSPAVGLPVPTPPVFPEQTGMRVGTPSGNGRGTAAAGAPSAQKRAEQPPEHPASTPPTLPVSAPSSPLTQTTRELVEAALLELRLGPDLSRLDAVNDHLLALGHQCGKPSISQALMAIHRDEFERGQPSLNLDFPS